MVKKIVCSDCGGAMQEGFIVDFAPLTRRVQSVWVEGPPEKDFYGVSLDKPNYYIKAYRCEKCEVLKLYAGPTKPKEGK